MTGLAMGLSAVLVVVAAIHLLWAIGYWWPIREERDLARAVVGLRGIERMPGAVATSLVVVALLFAATLPHMAPGPMWRVAMAGAAAVFAGRGIASFVPRFRALTPEPAFRRLDARHYGPLCLDLGAGFASLAMRSTP